MKTDDYGIELILGEKGDSTLNWVKNISLKIVEKHISKKN